MISPAAPLTRVKLTALDEDARRKRLTKMDADLMFLLAESNVGLVEQCLLQQMGYLNVRTFNGMGDTKAELRVALTADLGLNPGDPVTGAADRLQLACLLSAWESAK